MRRRRWDSKAKARIVLEGLSGRPVAELCTDYEISQAQYYQWRDKFLKGTSGVFDSGKQSRREARLIRENTRLKQLVGSLTMELKKLDEEEL